MKFAAKLFSIIFHPLLLPSIGMIIIFNSGTYLSNLLPQAKLLIIAVIFITTFLFPVLSLPVMKWQKLISSFSLDKRQERLLPILTTLIYYYLAYYMVAESHIQGIIRAFVLSGIIALTIAFFITLKWKISLHMIGLGSIFALIISISLRLGTNLSGFLIIWTLITGLTASSRLYLQSHNLTQIVVGFFVGSATVLTTILYYN